jgi:predicted nucleic acid-binding protein
VIAYFDTSAFVPLLVTEPGSAFCRQLWDSSDAVVSSRLLYVEAAAALAQALRLGRLRRQDHQTALRLLEQLWAEFDVVEIDSSVVDRAAELAFSAALRGYDAVHCAAAEQVADDDLVLASGDRALLAACARLGIATADTTPADDRTGPDPPT